MTTMNLANQTKNEKIHLEDRIGDFKYESGCQTAQDFREAFQRLWEEYGEEGFKEMHWNHAEAITSEPGINICHYDYGNGGFGSCFVELTPIDNYEYEGDLKLFYDIYSETDGHIEECGSFPVGEEEVMIKAFEETMLKTTEEIAKDWRFHEGELCEYKGQRIAEFIRYEIDFGLFHDEVRFKEGCVIQLIDDPNSGELQQELWVPSESVRPFFA